MVKLLSFCIIMSVAFSFVLQTSFLLAEDRPSTSGIMPVDRDEVEETFRSEEPDENYVPKPSDDEFIPEPEDFDPFTDTDEATYCS